MKLFQIEEPDGGPIDADAAGAAIGVDACATAAEVAVAVGGNAVLIADRPGWERELPVPGLDATADAWREFFEGVRLRAERGLTRPVTHLVVLLGAAPDADAAGRLRLAAQGAGLDILRIARPAELPTGTAGARGAAILAEELAPRPPITDFR